jgi:hypothetical protein
MTEINGNLVLESDAQKRWCPFSTQVVPGGASANRGVKGQLLEGSNCHGSKCMAWRWDHATEGRYGSCGLAGGIGSMLIKK